jgi:hypothetical protein
MHLNYIWLALAGFISGFRSRGGKHKSKREQSRIESLFRGGGGGRDAKAPPEMKPVLVYGLIIISLLPTVSNLPTTDADSEDAVARSPDHHLLCSS